MMTIIAGIPAEADTGAPKSGAKETAACGDYARYTSISYTSNHLIGVYLIEQDCGDHFNAKVDVHNYSTSPVGNRTSDLWSCDQGGFFQWPPWPMYIPPDTTWTSPAVNIGFQRVQGVVFHPRTSSTDPFTVDAATDCA
jgi:hypothetical protein